MGIFDTLQKGSAKFCPFYNVFALQQTQVIQTGGQKSTEAIPCLKACEFYDDINNVCSIKLAIQIWINVFAEIKPEDIALLVQSALKYFSQKNQN